MLECPSHWHEQVSALEPHLFTNEKSRAVYDQVIAESARHFHPLWTLSRHKYGWLSAQVETTHLHSVDTVVARGLELARLSPNVMVKVPGSQNGYRAIERLVANGCSINNTLCFTVSQFNAAIAAIQSGRLLARRKHVDLSNAQYVITFMIGRFGDEPEFDLQARQRGITLTASDKRWAEVAIYQALQASLQCRYTQVQLLLCSVRVDIDEVGYEHSWHLERTGADATLYTLTPEVIEFLLRRQANGTPVLPAAQRLRIPDEVLSKLLCIPYFVEAYFERAIKPAAFEHHPAFIRARDEASVAHSQLQAFVERSAVALAHPMLNPVLKADAAQLGAYL
ncbi:transaldolase family protein [Pseudomonas huanghezhanensis]|uniref:transaldolase family protein n=1 Tax=Pseudomonas huanghezhanensis TaxID=3002903 RepID=UPI0022865568|nr:transaldolase family protein [Pseudomonas sp. BSw22131]